MTAAGSRQTPTDRFDRPVRDLRISLTDRCNFRCNYCMPAEVFGEHYEYLPRAEILSFEEIERLTAIFYQLGVVKLRLTGGEPLLRRDLPDLVGRLRRAAPRADLTLTTNGYLLERSARELKTAGLDRVTISLDALDDDTFKRMNGRGFAVAPVLAGIDAAQGAGLRPLKINCVVVKGVNEHALEDLTGYFKGRGAIVRFIEYMDVGTRNHWKLDQVVTAAAMAARIRERFDLVQLPANYPGEVARRFGYADGDGEIGFITSVSAPFCGACTRARLTPDGRLVTCLFASDGFDLRAMLRDGASDDELADAIGAVWSDRSDRYSELRSQLGPDEALQSASERIEMYQLGG